MKYAVSVFDYCSFTISAPMRAKRKDEMKKFILALLAGLVLSLAACQSPQPAGGGETTTASTETWKSVYGVPVEYSYNGVVVKFRPKTADATIRFFIDPSNIATDLSTFNQSAGISPYTGEFSYNTGYISVECEGKVWYFVPVFSGTYAPKASFAGVYLKTSAVNLIWGTANLTLSSDTSGATVYYTLDGSDPVLTGSSKSPSGASVNLVQNSSGDRVVSLKIQALASDGTTASAITVYPVTIRYLAPDVTPVASLTKSDGRALDAIVNRSTEFTLTPVVSGTEIRYTTDGSTPSTTGSASTAVYSGPFTMSAGTVITYISKDPLKVQWSPVTAVTLKFSTSAEPTFWVHTWNNSVETVTQVLGTGNNPVKKGSTLEIRATGYVLYSITTDGAISNPSLSYSVPLTLTDTAYIRATSTETQKDTSSVAVVKVVPYDVVPPVTGSYTVSVPAVSVAMGGAASLGIVCSDGVVRTATWTLVSGSTISLTASGVVTPLAVGATTVQAYVDATHVAQGVVTVTQGVTPPAQKFSFSLAYSPAGMTNIYLHQRATMDYTSAITTLIDGTVTQTFQAPSAYLNFNAGNNDAGWVSAGARTVTITGPMNSVTFSAADAVKDCNGNWQIPLVITANGTIGKGSMPKD